MSGSLQSDHFLLTELISGWNTARVKSRWNTCRKSSIRLATRRPEDTKTTDSAAHLGGVYRLST